jgi:ABC-type multidrug transport system ATPase subunit
MLAIGRALMTNPRLLILDEATEGLAPLIREEIWSCLSMLKARGQSVLVIDKNVANLARIADRHYIIERGRTVWSGTSEALIAEPDLPIGIWACEGGASRSLNCKSHWASSSHTVATGRHPCWLNNLP